MAHELEMIQLQQVAYVVLGAGVQVIDAQHIAPLLDQLIAQMRA